jgi:hypothetical protein
MSFLSFSQKENKELAEMSGYDSLLADKYEHYATITGLGLQVHMSVGYDAVYRVNDWFKAGSGVSLGFAFYKKPETVYSFMPRVYGQFGYKWFWIETGIEHNYNFNFYALFAKDKYFTCPGACKAGFELFISPYASMNFQIGRKRRHELDFVYNPLFGQYRFDVYFDQHLFGVRYRFKFL